MPDRVLAAAITLALVVAGSFVFVSYRPKPAEVGTTQSGSHTVPLDQIVSGGPPPDGIPSIDHPKFVPAASAAFLSDSYDLVIGINYNGAARAYPLLILVWHEIVNDVVGGTPIAITYCPLCFSTTAFVREINGQPVEFGTSGRLYNNNLVMYDRRTGSLWSQIWGEAIAGNLTGSKLQKVPIDVLPWGEWKRLHPDTVVLSKETGFGRPYNDDADPYLGYDLTNQIWFPLNHHDSRLPVKDRVLGLIVGGESKAYPLDNLTGSLAVDSLGGRSVLVWRVGHDIRFFDPVVNGKLLHFKDANGTLVDFETGSTWDYDGVAVSGLLTGTSLTRYVAETAYWFAWAAFYPNTQVYP